ncbi:RagB/SusD family nutrient uptake outer membrane protein [Panacibacter ginsenosidivorans]|uniref:RagB/SusD family nutrient uptake outer membrane protein n=1 Tax=Panacibacter ginsenosidivorans TaxID=1813871 RepID=A0A5B8VAE1_9BACT|nr:RagB/SusD family nutrient uptake outer membrane protein [Panacibacter ginsenosidivorans]QEC67923.1 RagB/SusD family nutrient uptake outer membrane protein [Panacibacter ginsenosidivorans]
MKTILHLLLAALFFAACKKSSFLDKRPDQSLVVPQTLTDMQALLDNDRVMNGAGGFGVVPALGEMGTTDYFLEEQDLNGFIPPMERNAYTWQKTIYNGETVPDWNLPYAAVFYANNALEGIEKIERTNANAQAWDNVKGSALFYRAYMFYQLAQVFAAVYDSSTAATDKGIPLRLKADINETISRSTVQQTYDRIIEDLNEALPLLPSLPLYATRPSKAAVYALLSKVYLNVYDYAKANENATNCLQLQDELMDYNEVDTTVTFPFQPLNSETIFFEAAIPHLSVTPFVAGIDTALYNSYTADDLRKKLFFTQKESGVITFMGSYGLYDLFNGIATDEIMLIQAECLARMNKTTEALNVLNNLLVTRFRTGTYVPYEASNAEEALDITLTERRKELIMRGTRWTDLRRLNEDPLTTTILQRTVQGTTYTLPPNDPRYVYPIPDDVIGYNPGMFQNPR